jgi:hypothetical protein
MCFSAYWIASTLVWLVVVCGIIAFIALLLPYILAWLGWTGSIVIQAIRIIIAVIVTVTLIWFCYDLLTCAGLAGGIPRRA